MKTFAALVFALVMASAVGVAGLSQAPPPQQKPPATPAQPPAQPPAQKPPAPAAPRQARPAPSRLSLTVFVSDTTGAPLPGVRVHMEGPIPREGVTGREGTVKFQGLRAGEYRLHFEADKFVTLEKDVLVKGAAAEIEASLSPAPAPPKPAEPPPAPKPAPTARGGMPLPPADPNAAVQVVMLPDWIEKNYIGRNDPQKDTAIGRTSAAAATILQVRDPIKERSHNDADEMLYVIAGEGVLRSKGREQGLEAGAFVVIPHGVVYGIERRGRNPLIALSILSQ